MTKRAIRVATPKDIDAIIKLGMAELEREAYSSLRISPRKVREMAVECISSSNNFAYVAEKDGVVVGAVCALVHPMMFYERSQATVLQFFCDDPGQGIKLLRTFLSWVEGRPVIKMVVFTLEPNADPRIGKLLTRLGLTCELPIYMKLR